MISGQVMFYSRNVLVEKTISEFEEELPGLSSAVIYILAGISLDSSLNVVL